MHYLSTGASSATLSLPSRSAAPLVNPHAELQGIKEKNKERENVNPNPIAVDKKHRTVRAGAQFKSPLSATAAASAGKSSIRLTPSIQMLERKVQLLRRAVKVKKEQEEVVLKDLIKTWTEAGREVSYQLFELAREGEDLEALGVVGV
ncbi:hypothetical protein AAF712_002159 [Marasmius tenuissimus]|uniref:Meiosis protein 5 homolog n=1 Tax=Marasmius tenuissimus TaxID=585030 RepID=A0ABR3AD70_9AGAR